MLLIRERHSEELSWLDKLGALCRFCWVLNEYMGPEPAEACKNWDLTTCDSKKPIILHHSFIPTEYISLRIATIGFNMKKLFQCGTHVLIWHHIFLVVEFWDFGSIAQVRGYRWKHLLFARLPKWLDIVTLISRLLDPFGPTVLFAVCQCTESCQEVETSDKAAQSIFTALAPAQQENLSDCWCLGNLEIGQQIEQCLLTNIFALTPSLSVAKLTPKCFCASFSEGSPVERSWPSDVKAYLKNLAPPLSKPPKHTQTILWIKLFKPTYTQSGHTEAHWRV